MKKLLALLLALAMCLSLAACGAGNNTPGEDGNASSGETAQGGGEPEETPTSVEAAGQKVGLICANGRNSAENAAHVDALSEACTDLGFDPDSQLVVKYDVAEDDDCYKTAKELVKEGCSIIFSNAYAHQDSMLRAAKENPEVVFVAVSGDKAAQSGLDNYKNLFPLVHESRYLSGVAAGLKLRAMLRDGAVSQPLVGYVAPVSCPEVISGYTAFFLGVRSVVEDALMDVQYTGAWYDGTAEGDAAEGAAAQKLMDLGCAVIGQHSVSTGAPAAVQAAKDGGAAVYCVGYGMDMLSAAPTAALTSAVSNWPVLYEYTLMSFVSGGDVPTDFSGGFELDAVGLTPLGPEAAEDTDRRLSLEQVSIANGESHVFDCSAFTVDGKNPTSILIDMDGDSNGDTEGVQDGVFQEGVLRSAPAFNLHIDGITELTAEG